MKPTIAELDFVEVTSDLPIGIIEGARGTVMAVHTDSCTVEFIDVDGLTIGLIEIPTSELEVVLVAGAQAQIAREE